MAAKSKRKRGGVVRTPASLPAAAPDTTRAGVLRIDQLRPSPTNPRKSFPAESLQALADSIRAVGVRQRLLVRPVAAEVHPAPRWDDAARTWRGVDHFEVVDGERRFRAAALAGLDAVPVDVCDLTDEEMLLVQLVSNDQREDVRPSEQAAAYKRLADAGRTAEQIAADTGKPVGFVRGLLRLGRLPAWALAAVDAGTLPRATAELAARVPGEEGRARCAAMVLRGGIDSEADPATESFTDNAGHPWTILSYRDTRDLIRNHFTKELKGSPFSLKVLYAEAETLGTGHDRYIQSCDECPKRAGNDPEAVAEGTRADVCLDPDCYREKVAAYRAQEVARAAAKGIEEADLGGLVSYSNGRPPRGWCDVKEEVSGTELGAELPAGSEHRGDTLKHLLARPGNDGMTPSYIAFGTGGKAVTLVKTADARKALRAVGVLPRAKPTPSTDAAPDRTTAAAQKRNPDAADEAHARGLSTFDVDGRALVTAARIVAECGEEQFGDLADLSVAGPHPVEHALRLAARAWAYDFCLCSGALNRPVLAAVFPDAEGWIKNPPLAARDLAEIDGWPAAKCLAFLMRLAVGAEVSEGPNTDTARQLFAFAELDWGPLQEQARRELSGGESAGAKFDRPEADAGAVAAEELAAMSAASATELKPEGDPSAWADLAPTASDAPECDEVRRCRVCGCTDENCARCVAKIGRPCEWREADLCSACVPIAAFEGEYLGDLDIELEVVERGSVLQALTEGNGAKPVSAKPFHLADRLHINVGGVWQYGHESFECLPLYALHEFQARFPNRERLNRPAYRDDTTDAERDEAYFGVRVMVGKAEFVIGPKAEERRLTTKGPDEPRPSTPAPPATSNAIHLRLVPDFPVEAANALAAAGVQTLADLDAKVAAAQTTGSPRVVVTRYSFLKNLLGAPVGLAAGDAMVDYDAAKANPEPESPAKPVKAKKRKAVAK